MIRPALLPIPLQWVCILALHLDLGIFPWIWDVMIAEWREIDGQPAARLDNTGLHTSDSDTFTRAVTLNTEISKKGWSTNTAGSSQHSTVTGNIFNVKYHVD